MTEREISGFAVRSLLLEASLAPKPGLVTPYDSGSHKDMSFRTFLDSALALSDCFAECAAIGKENSESPPPETRALLKKAGLDGEKAMYRATGGVNTHKGAIYLLGFLCAAAGRLKTPEKSVFSPRELTETAASFVQGAVERELASKKTPAFGEAETLTAGERAYRACGLTGARGEAERGYPLALEALVFLRARLRRMSLKNALTDTLFFIVARNGDTNLYARGGTEGLKTAQELAGAVLREGGVATPGGREKIKLAERVFVEKNLSPGGSADILSSAIFLFSVAHTQAKEIK
jgi:triphosphoribosyl-dephospho-CoA synthase